MDDSTANWFVGLVGKPAGVIWYASAAAVISALATLLIRRSDVKVRV